MQTTFVNNKYPTDGEILRVACYIRISDAHKQGDNSSKETQIASVKKFCDDKRWPYDVFIEEESAGRIKSGKQVSRPILEDIIDRLNKKEFQALIITKTDRLVRDAVVFGKIKEQSDDNHWPIFCIDENIDSRTLQGQMMLGIMVAFSATERMRITQRITSGCKRTRVAAELEGVPYSITSYNVSDELKRTVIFLYNRRKMSLKQIALKFNNEGVKRPVEKYKDAPWDEYAVKNLLTHLGEIKTNREKKRNEERQKAREEITSHYQDVKQILALGRRNKTEKD